MTSQVSPEFTAPSYIIEPDLDLLKDENEVYRIAVENLALMKSSEEFSNKGPVHASIVFGNIFKTAREYVKIYAGDFCGKISDRDYYIENLRAFLKKGIPIYILFQKDPNPKSLALNLLKEYSHKNIYVRKINKYQDIFTSHFTIADNRMFRIETRPDIFEAECSFNSPETTKSLEKVYSYLLANSDVYKIPTA